MTSPTRTPTRPRARGIASRRVRAALIVGAATISGALSAASLTPSLTDAPGAATDAQLPTLPAGDAGLAGLLTAPLVALIVIVLAATALVIAALRRRPTE